MGKVSPRNVRCRAGGGQAAAHLQELCSHTATCTSLKLMARHCLASTFWKQQFPNPRGQEFTGNRPQNPALLRLDLFFFRNVITRMAVEWIETKKSVTTLLQTCPVIFRP